MPITTRPIAPRNVYISTNHRQITDSLTAASAKYDEIIRYKRELEDYASHLENQVKSSIGSNFGVTPNTARGWLDALDSFFAKNDDNGECKKLWDVLCALRGPDVGGAEVKMPTTAIVRGAAFPRAAASIRLYGTALLKDDGSYPAKRSKLWSAGGHFIKHVNDAFAALKLNFTTMNGVPAPVQSFGGGSDNTFTTDAPYKDQYSSRF